MLTVAASTALTEIAFTLLSLAVLAAIGHVMLTRQNRRLQPVPKHGPLSCSACNGLVAHDVRYVGQEVACPRCGCRLTAPGLPPSTVPVSTRVIIVLTVSAAIVLLLLGRR